jgi:hypothetical protein
VDGRHPPNGVGARRQGNPANKSRGVVMLLYSSFTFTFVG